MFFEFRSSKSLPNSATLKKIESVQSVVLFRFRNSKESSVELDDIQPLASDAQICVTTSVILLAIYTATLHPSVPGGDSGKGFFGL